PVWESAWALVAHCRRTRNGSRPRRRPPRSRSPSEPSSRTLPMPIGSAHAALASYRNTSVFASQINDMRYDVSPCPPAWHDARAHAPSHADELLRHDRVGRPRLEPEQKATAPGPQRALSGQRLIPRARERAENRRAKDFVGKLDDLGL